LVGTNAVRGPNALHLLRFCSDVNELTLDASFPHETGAVVKICTSPYDSNLLLTAAEQSNTATLYKLPLSTTLQDEGSNNDDDASETQHTDTSNNKNNNTIENSITSDNQQQQHKLEKMAELTSVGGSHVMEIIWRDAAQNDGVASSSSEPGDVVTMDRKGRLAQWDMAVLISLRVVETAGDDSYKEPISPPRAVFDPHGNGNSLAHTQGASIRTLDWRSDTSVPTGTVQSIQAHRYAVTDLDYNPNKPYLLASAGMDGLLKFWDLRSAKHPLMVARGGHSHWVWNVKYNPFHDQLVLSSGTDSLVNLWRVSSISSAPLLTFDDFADDEAAASETAAPNVRVDRYEHADSVYAACWGAADAWHYMSVGYDGKAVLSHVPSKEKYKILL
jgi:WD40 repeat protein